jgi:CheY-like chemotaxis protein
MTSDEPSTILTGRRVLVVEDQFLVAEEMRRAVARLGGQVIGPVGAVSEGLRLAQSERLDLALLDVNLHGEAVDALADHLQREGVPMIFATGYGRASLARQFQSVPHLEKPVSAAALAAAVARCYPGVVVP